MSAEDDHAAKRDGLAADPLRFAALVAHQMQSPLTTTKIR
jgi:hypothetical protein